MLRKRKKIKGYDSGGSVGSGLMEGMNDVLSGYETVQKFKKIRKEMGSSSSSVSSDSGGSGSAVSKSDPEGTSTPTSSAPVRVKDDNANSTSFARGGKVRKVDHRSQYMKGKR